MAMPNIAYETESFEEITALRKEARKLREEAEGGGVGISLIIMASEIWWWACIWLIFPKRKMPILICWRLLWSISDSKTLLA